MKALVAIHEIVLGRGHVVSPGDSFQAEDDVAGFLLAAGAAQVDEAEEAEVVEQPKPKKGAKPAAQDEELV